MHLTLAKNHIHSDTFCAAITPLAEVAPSLMVTVNPVNFQVMLDATGVPRHWHRVSVAVDRQLITNYPL